MTNNNMNRRSFVKLGGGCLGMAAVAGTPGLSFATGDAASDKKLIVLFAGGGWDGLHVVPPVGRNEYHSLRGAYALDRPQANTPRSAIALDSVYGLNPGLSSLLPLFQSGEMTIFHGVEPFEPSRNNLSHFEMTAEIFTGGIGSQRNLPGFLNRLEGELGALPNPGGVAVTGSNAVPQILQGSNSSAAWVPPTATPTQNDILNMISANFSRATWFGDAVRRAVQTRNAFNPVAHSLNDTSQFNSFYGGLPTQAQLLAHIMSLDDNVAPAVGYIQAPWFDTHGTGSPENYHSYILGRLQQVALSIQAIRQTFMAANKWNKVVIAVISEFGRSLSPNGSGGTDHGHATNMMLITGNPLLQNYAIASAIGGVNVPSDNQRRVLTNGQLDLVNPGINGSLRGSLKLFNILRPYIGAHYGLDAAAMNRVLPSPNA